MKRERREKLLKEWRVLLKEVPVYVVLLALNLFKAISKRDLLTSKATTYREADSGIRE